MTKNKNEKRKGVEVTQEVESHNDQLGENASEEYRSENYDNALKNKSQKNSMK